ncbi:hypothetical protein SPFM15_00218 [Salmonella phage SPFM15]|nr:hypothetical protein SPFM5_00213 [Salmonella phage SPFM5]VFR13842.1 hypothetical protein SPFM15_00218 [Salmonella phage SPFM15]
MASGRYNTQSQLSLCNEYGVYTRYGTLVGEVFQSAWNRSTHGILYPGMPVKYVFATDKPQRSKLEMSLGTIVQTTAAYPGGVVNAPIDPDKHFSEFTPGDISMTTPDKFVAQADPNQGTGYRVGSVRVLDGRSSSIYLICGGDTSSLEYRDQAALNLPREQAAHIDRTTDIAGNVYRPWDSLKFNNTTKPKLVIYHYGVYSKGIGVFQYLQRWYLRDIVIPDSEDFLSVFDYLQKVAAEGQLKGIEYDEEEQQAYHETDGLTVARSILADTLPEGLELMDESMWFLRNRQVGGIYAESPTMFLSQSDEKSIALVTQKIAGVFNYRGIVINNRDHKRMITSSAEGDLKVKLLLRRGFTRDICLLTHLTLAIPYSHITVHGAPVTVLKMLSIIHTGQANGHIANARGLPAIDYGIFL